LNPGAPILTATHGAIDPNQLIDIGGGDWAAAAFAAPAGDGEIQTFSIVREEPLDAAMVNRFLETVAARRGPDLLRVKGIVNVAGHSETPVVVQGVQNLFHPPRVARRLAHGGSAHTHRFHRPRYFERIGGAAAR
jgi:G3E family GTPase